MEGPENFCQIMELKYYLFIKTCTIENSISFSLSLFYSDYIYEHVPLHYSETLH